ncbi:MAG: FAD-dependent oxidoreductase [Sphingomonas sp.]|uniref:flavin monoamine oxidase family protein n=1 Tax=Sphingomonas sp. TaxID=28214 RepID=UPI001B1731AE|nr:NAD(P)/FAD-dependent oxidoreductase [Sphingomonas sp.]MBO9623863.1 FAD-dependent oxidoreductase [Sphingomonas sp.]
MVFERMRFEAELQTLSEAGRPGQVALKGSPERLPPPPKACADLFAGTRVAVVGAGLAGLMAALRLRERGVAVTVYEARAKVGGRVSTRKKFAAGRIIEEGAELIGSFHTAWLELALRYRLSVISRMDSEHYDRQGLRLKLAVNGRELANAEYFDLSDKLDAVLTKIADFADGLVFDPSTPWMYSTLAGYDGEDVENALQQRFGVRKTERRPDGTQQITGLWRMLEHLLVNDEVAQLKDMNFLGLLCKVKAGQGKRLGRPLGKNPEDDRQRKMGYWDELEIFRCAEGCGTLAEKMAADLKAGVKGKLKTRINLLSPVTQIHLTDSGVVLGISKASPNGEIEKEAPYPALYDYVVFTAPPTVWNRVSVTTGGKIEKGKALGGKAFDLKAKIGVMRDGPAIKHFTITGERFWLSEVPPAAPDGGTAELGQIWEETDNQMSTGADQDAVLAVFAGPLIASPMKPGGMAFRAPSKDECTAALRKLYPKAYPKSPKILFANWPETPFIRTGYASPAKGQVMTVGAMLARPWGRMIFAGEHTHMAFFGYMEGALRSGERAATLLEGLVCGGAIAPQHAGGTLVA